MALLWRRTKHLCIPFKASALLFFSISVCRVIASPAGLPADHPTNHWLPLFHLKSFDAERASRLILNCCKLKINSVVMRMWDMIGGGFVILRDLVAVWHVYVQVELFFQACSQAFCIPCVLMLMLQKFINILPLGIQYSSLDSVILCCDCLGKPEIFNDIGNDRNGEMETFCGCGCFCECGRQDYNLLASISALCVSSQELEG